MCLAKLKCERLVVTAGHISGMRSSSPQVTFRRAKDQPFHILVEFPTSKPSMGCPVTAATERRLFQVKVRTER